MNRKCLIILLIILGVVGFAMYVKSNKVKLVENTDYFVKGEFTGKYLDVTKRGYYIDSLKQPDSPYFYTICMGEKNTGGYSMKIKEVNKIDAKTEVIVEEIAPDKNAIVTMAFTYPTIILEFPKYQENIVIKNTKGEKFVQLKDY